MDKLILSVIILLSIYLVNGCEHPDDPFLIFNNTQNNISFNSYNIDGSGFASEVIIIQNESRFTGGGGIIDVDSVLFVRKSDNDSLIYRNEKHGDDIFLKNHFFNINNWIERDKNEFHYSVNEEDFDN